MPIQLYALAVGTFAVGTTEFVIMGLLPTVAHDLGVSIPVAGLLVTGYALGVVVGAPLVTLGANRMDRRTLLVGLMALFFIGNLLAAVAPGYNVLMAGRIVSSLMHGAFFGVGSVVGAGLVPRHKQGSAMALIFSGLALSNIIGVPLGTAIGQAYGWRVTFGLVSLLGLVAGGFLYAVLKPQPAPPHQNLKGELAVFRRPGVWLALGATAFSFAGVFVVWTYIAPILGTATGLSPHAITLTLLVYGVGLTLGNTLVGRWADRSLPRALVGILIALIVCMLLFAATMQSAPLAIATIFLLGFTVFGAVPALQMQIMAAAEGAPNLASALNIAAFNLGNAAGAWLGGLLISAGYKFSVLALVGAIASSFGLALAIAAQMPGTTRRSAPAR